LDTTGISLRVSTEGGFAMVVAKKSPANRTSTKKATAKKSTSYAKSGGTKKWSAKVTTDSTHPDEGLFKKGATTIARELASREVSPKGPGSGMRMLTFYINRAGHNLPESRKKVLERAKVLLKDRIEKEK
jgi:hypothetical protein